MFGDVVIHQLDRRTCESALEVVNCVPYNVVERDEDMSVRKQIDQ